MAPAQVNATVTVNGVDREIRVPNNANFQLGLDNLQDVAAGWGHSDPPTDAERQASSRANNYLRLLAEGNPQQQAWARNKIQNLGNALGAEGAGADFGTRMDAANTFLNRAENNPTQAPGGADPVAGGAGGPGVARGAGQLDLRQLMPLLLLGAMMGGGGGNPMMGMIMMNMMMQTMAQGHNANEQFCRDQMRGMNPQERIDFMRAWNGLPAPAEAA